MTERDALSWLLSFADPVRGVGWNPRSSPEERWKTGRTRALLDLAGAPDRALRRRVVIAGTNGKGSTGALLESILRAAGWHTGAYSQPHLHSFRERFRLDGEPVDPARFADAVERLRPLVDALRAAYPDAGEPTAFELTTVLAAMLFAESGVDAALLEVGLGGRLDQVNAIDSELAIVTSIGYDHVQILGSTLGSIAREKAGVLRPGALALSARQRPAAARALAATARRLGTHLRTISPLAHISESGSRGLRPPPGGPWGFTSKKNTPSPAAAGEGAGGEGSFSDPSRGQLVLLPSGTPAWLSLLGEHQRQNAALAVAAATELLGPGADDAIARGLATAQWPGRLEWVPGCPPIVVDGAHNPPGAVALASALDEIAPAGKIALVFGCARDKSVPGLLRPLLRRALAVWTVAADDPRATDPAALAREVHHLGSPATPARSTADALDRARASGADLVVVAGSLRVIAAARVALGLAGSC